MEKSKLVSAVEVSLNAEIAFKTACKELPEATTKKETRKALRVELASWQTANSVTDDAGKIDEVASQKSLKLAYKSIEEAMQSVYDKAYGDRKNPQGEYLRNVNHASFKRRACKIAEKVTETVLDIVIAGIEAVTEDTLRMTVTSIQSLVNEGLKLTDIASALLVLAERESKKATTKKATKK